MESVQPAGRALKMTIVGQGTFGLSAHGSMTVAAAAAATRTATRFRASTRTDFDDVTPSLSDCYIYTDLGKRHIVFLLSV